VTDVRSLAPLPKGRHTLTRDQVEESQRLRLAVATAEALAEDGYANTPVAAILDRAGVSRQTFYQLYGNKLDCFLDTLDLVGAVLVDQLGGALAGGRGSPLARAGAAIERYLETIADNLPFARLYIVEVHAAGPPALVRRAELQHRVVDALADLLGADTPDDRFACETYVAAVSALVTLPVVTGDVDAIRALRDPLLGQLRRLTTD
jgi:AcrR family transcriptional regulator